MVTQSQAQIQITQELAPFTCQTCPKFRDSGEEDLLRSEYEPGKLVKLIDSNKSHTEWTSFIVVGKRHNPHRYRNTETFLNQTDWYYLLATIDKPIVGLLWVAEDEICHHNQSHIIEPEGVF